MKIIIDGNDGTGKTALVTALRNLGYVVEDRGVPTKMTDDATVQPNAGEFYLILDAPVDICRKRLAKAGRNLSEKYHTVEDLTYYRQRFLDVAVALGKRAFLLDSQGSPEDSLKQALIVLSRLQGEKHHGVGVLVTNDQKDLF